MSMKHAWLVAAVLLVGVANLSYAEDAGDKAAGDQKAEKEKKDKGAKAKGKPERLWSGGPKVDDLKTELGLTDDQIAKAKEALAVVEKKNTELEAKAEVKAAEEAVQKAKEALKAAEAKNDEAKGNFDLLTERKKAVIGAVPEDKKAKAEELLHFKPDAGKAKEKREKKAEADKK